MAASGSYLEIVDSENALVMGESEGRDYEGHIDITGWDWGVTDNSSKKTTASTDRSAKGAAAGATKAAAVGGEVGVLPSLITFTKPVDSSTTRLMTAMSSAEKLKEATFTVREELVSVRDDSKEAFRLHVRLEKVTVVSYKLTGRSAEHRVDLEETWGLDYEKIEFLYETERMRVEFDRPAGSDKRGSEKAAPDPAQLMKKYNELDQLVKAKGKAG